MHTAGTVDAERRRILRAFLETGLAPEPGPLWPELARQRWIVLDADGRRWHANCAWDALAVAAMVRRELGLPSVLPLRYGNSRTPLEIEAPREGPVRKQAVVHFAVPLREWWRDIAFT
ncbi:MAG: hypothetical protein HY858_08980 [Candidatus Solibacter usitatus]|nr:hypothetical protein [Candidatus Solibacter usitatus]